MLTAILLTMSVIISIVVQHLYRIPAYRRYKGGNWYYYYINPLSRGRKVWMQEKLLTTSGFHLLLREEEYPSTR